jgi:hypothetical protein
MSPSGGCTLTAPLTIMLYLEKSADLWRNGRFNGLADANGETRGRT